MVWAESAPIRPRGKMTAARKAAVEADERRYGRRFRIFAGVVAFGAGAFNFGIFPAVGARFSGAP